MMTPEAKKLATFALDYSRRGWAVFPTFTRMLDEAGAYLCSCRKGYDCERPGKHPACPHGLKDATANAEDLLVRLNEAVGWGDGVLPDIAVSTGNGLLVIDIDAKDDGYRKLYDLEVKLGPLPEGPTVKTRSGGRHFYFGEIRPLRTKPGALVKGIDVQSIGKYVMAPPSSGYRWHPRLNPNVSLPALPSPWFDAIYEVSANKREARSSAVPSLTLSIPRFPFETAKLVCIEVVSHPAWGWATENADEVDRTTWMGFATNLVAAADNHPKLIDAARVEFHKLSEGYYSYKPGETDKVFNGAAEFLSRRGGAPMRWETMAAIPSSARTHGHLNLVEDARTAVFRRR
jgi:hypothetical protein